MNPKPLVIILGATASGKTELALTLAQRHPSQLISVDSAQIYRHMDIGTAKPDRQTLQQHPHALIDLIEPEQTYSAAQFCRQAQQHIQQAHQHNRLPILVGGTMLYIHALLGGLDDLPPANPQIRVKIAAEIATIGLTAMHDKLAQYDPISAAKIAPTDRQRLIRLHELYQLTHTPPSQLFTQSPQPPNWHITAIGLHPERAVLHQRIEQRFHQMLKQGFIDEVAQLKARPNLSADHPSMRSVGYRQLWQYLEGQHSLNHAIELGIIATRQLAKRQITWMRNRLQTHLELPLIDPNQTNPLTHILNRLEFNK